jgi:Flp pilus assembly protein TadD
MILVLALLQSVTGPPADASVTRQRYEDCVALATRSPAEGASEADRWRLVGGGYLARQCLGIAYANQQRWLPAATAFEQAAREAEVAKDGRAAGFWAQTGNALLAGGEAAKARAALNAAVALNVLTGLELGEVHLDRARALVAAGDTAGARADLDKATTLAAADPLAWLLSATLARRTGDLPRAEKDIAKALALSADDAQVRLEAGNIAARKGDEATARAQWNAAIVNAPESDAAKSARAALAQFAAAPAP